MRNGYQALTRSREIPSVNTQKRFHSRRRHRMAQNAWVTVRQCLKVLIVQKPLDLLINLVKMIERNAQRQYVKEFQYI